MFHSFHYRGGTIHISILDRCERIRVQYYAPGSSRFSLRDAKSVHAAKCFLTRHAGICQQHNGVAE
ncbi:hypothetical protein [Noviherbaspirillum pedocola]|uniref:Uncharacterized protein n=1 Tax=Noviherbaspirillum pedocola TaxID=2801341 RepID=A0A934SVE7_9BURK|nr:hypothetical protein [Noviherbaspirillum pedocola]MBK4736053.1 hypothetical protein [Noviherbaspirillum pedocola]